LSSFEDKLSDAWSKCLSGDPFAFKVISFLRLYLTTLPFELQADFVLIDVGPNLEQ